MTHPELLTKWPAAHVSQMRPGVVWHIYGHAVPIKLAGLPEMPEGTIRAFLPSGQEMRTPIGCLFAPVLPENGELARALNGRRMLSQVAGVHVREAASAREAVLHACTRPCPVPHQVARLHADYQVTVVYALTHFLEWVRRKGQ